MWETNGKDRAAASMDIQKFSGKYYFRFYNYAYPFVFFFLFSSLVSWTLLLLLFNRIRKLVTSSIIFVIRPSLVKKFGNISSLAAMQIFSFCHDKKNKCVKDFYLPTEFKRCWHLVFFFVCKAFLKGKVIHKWRYPNFPILFIYPQSHCEPSFAFKLTYDHHFC